MTGPDETPAPEPCFAGVIRRSLAWLVDILPIVAVGAALRVADLAGFMVVMVLYHAAFRCRTPGRWLSGVVIVRLDGTEIGTLRSAARTLLSPLSFLTLGLGLWMAVFDARGRTLHDRLAGTLPARAPAGTSLSLLRRLATVVGFVSILVGETAVDSAGNSKPFDEIVRPLDVVALPNGKLAMVAHMLTGNDQSEDVWRTTLKRMKAMGVQVVEIGQIRWDDLEKEPGRYSWGYAETVLRLNQEEKIGLEFVADIAMFINPGLDGVPKLPSHLEGKAFDDPLVIESLGNVYLKFLELPGADRVTYLFQHFENAEASLADRPADRPHLQALLRQTFRRAKTARPGLRTGVCIESYGKPAWPRQMMQDWNVAIGTDVIPIISFGPAHFEPEGDVTRTELELLQVLRDAGGIPVAINECGLPSAKECGSSDEKQVAFVRELFSALRKHHQSLEFVTWYEYSDLSPIASLALGIYLAGISGNPLGAGYFSAMMGSRGLVTTEGEAKPSGEAWCAAAADYHARRRGR